YVRVALPGEPPERAGGAGPGVEPLGYRGMRGEVRPERPDGPGRDRLGPLRVQVLVPALPPVGEEAVLGEVRLQARIGQPVGGRVRVPGDRAAVASSLVHPAEQRDDGLRVAGPGPAQARG